jgi:dihydrofolate reductase
MRRIRYQVACSLDGFLSDSTGGTGWITEEPEIDFEELYNQFDTLLMGRLTYEDIPQARQRVLGEAGRGIFPYPPAGGPS